MSPLTRDAGIAVEHDKMGDKSINSLLVLLLLSGLGITRRFSERASVTTIHQRTKKGEEEGRVRRERAFGDHSGGMDNRGPGVGDEKAVGKSSGPWQTAVTPAAAAAEKWLWVRELPRSWDCEWDCKRRHGVVDSASISQVLQPKRPPQQNASARKVYSPLVGK